MKFSLSPIESFNTSSLTGTLLRPLTVLMRQMQHDAARRALMQLDDHLLRDIGLNRGEIDAVVRQLGQR